MQKYLGNKKKILNRIGDIVESLGVKDGVFLDIFAGTNNVAKFFKQKGFKVITNDINECSAIFSKATIENDHVPNFEKIIKRYKLASICDEDLIQRYFLLNSNGLKYSWSVFKPTEKNLVYVLTFLSFLPEFKLILKKDKDFKVYPLISNNYCPGGKKSVYKSKSGKSVNRMFFTDTHGKHIDMLINLLKFWKDKQLVSDGEFNILVSTVVHAATLFSNTSGVYEAFYKTWFPNTKQKFRLPVPDLETLRKPKGRSYCMNAIDFVDHFHEPVDILYVDPPYNTRQYDSNYHLLNTIAQFDRISNLRAFEENITGARGQNNEYSYRSPFSSKKTFNDSLKKLVQKTHARFVLVSYFDGDDNLWNESGNKTGIRVISEILKDVRYFKPKTFKIIKIPRQNFQSRSGQMKETINELVFCVQKISRT